MDKQQAKAIWDEYASRVSVPRHVQEAVEAMAATEQAAPKLPGPAGEPTVVLTTPTQDILGHKPPKRKKAKD